MNPNLKRNPPRLVELPNLSERSGAAAGPPLIDAPLGLIRGVKVQLVAMLGGVSLTVGDLSALRDGSVLKLDKLAHEPVDVMLEGQVIARGHLVAVDDNFGVRITEIVSPSAP